MIKVKANKGLIGLVLIGAVVFGFIKQHKNAELTEIKNEKTIDSLETVIVNKSTDFEHMVTTYEKEKEEYIKKAKNRKFCYYITIKNTHTLKHISFNYISSTVISFEELDEAINKTFNTNDNFGYTIEKIDIKLVPLNIEKKLRVQP